MSYTQSRLKRWWQNYTNTLIAFITQGIFSYLYAKIWKDPIMNKNESGNESCSSVIKNNKMLVSLWREKFKESVAMTVCCYISHITNFTLLYMQKRNKFVHQKYLFIQNACEWIDGFFKLRNLCKNIKERNLKLSRVKTFMSYYVLYYYYYKYAALHFLNTISIMTKLSCFIWFSIYKL